MERRGLGLGKPPSGLGLEFRTTPKLATENGAEEDVDDDDDADEAENAGNAGIEVKSVGISPEATHIGGTK
jgi:hypothetical protein